MKDKILINLSMKMFSDTELEPFPAIWFAGDGAEPASWFAGPGTRLWFAGAGSSGAAPEHC